jgi:hypothetical protein
VGVDGGSLVVEIAARILVSCSFGSSTEAEALMGSWVFAFSDTSLPHKTPTMKMNTRDTDLQQLH